MSTLPEHPAYSHTQQAPGYLILYGTALVCLGIGWLIGNTPGVYIASAIGVFIALLGPAFHHLTIEDRGDTLAIRFGPVGLFRRTVRYADIKSAEIGRTLILDGWGIHFSVRGGSVWNLWGRDCVVVSFKNGGKLRIGTDDVDHLAGFLRQKIAS
jgi:hypothetical protein